MACSTVKFAFTFINPLPTSVRSHFLLTLNEIACSCQITRSRGNSAPSRWYRFVCNLLLSRRLMWIQQGNKVHSENTNCKSGDYYSSCCKRETFAVSYIAGTNTIYLRTYKRFPPWSTIPPSDRFLLCFNPLTPELNPSAQRCLTKFFTGDFAS
jgi:hypothetical protein